MKFKKLILSKTKRIALLLCIIALTYKASSQSVTVTNKSQDSVVVLPKRIALRVIEDLYHYDNLKDKYKILQSNDSINNLRLILKDAVIYQYKEQSVNYQSEISAYKYDQLILNTKNMFYERALKRQKVKTTLSQIGAIVGIVTALVFIKH